MVALGVLGDSGFYLFLPFLLTGSLPLKITSWCGPAVGPSIGWKEKEEQRVERGPSLTHQLLFNSPPRNPK